MTSSKALALTLVLFATVAHASPQRLRKLSLHLRGVTPEATEYAARDAAEKAGKLKTFFEEKTKEYLASPSHVGKMMGRLDELFRLRTPDGLPETRLTTPSESPIMLPGGETYNALDLLFEEMAKKNLSWDTLLTAREYNVPVPGSSRDARFYGVVAPELPQNDIPGAKHTLNPIRFAADDPRIAGAITTGRFFNRYVTTNLNRNRGRAAAVFRIFLCDDMRAAVEPKAGEEEELLLKAFPKPKPNGVHVAVTDVDEDKHTKDPACIACHYKLDPLGRTFLTSGVLLSDEASPGALVYRRADGTLVNVAARGLGDIAGAIVLQPEYARCQVSHFWRWFIRGDRPPSTARMEEMVKAFDAVGRRTNDFIAWLVEQPEFLATEDIEGVTLVEAKPILGRCTTCHAGVPAEKIPSFVTFPIGTAEKHVGWVERIVKRLDLAHDGADKSMPPVSSAWQPSKEELALLKSWVAAGARDEAGKLTVPLEKAAEWLKPARNARPPLLTFKDSHSRYVSGHDVFRLLAQKFPNGNWADSKGECGRYNEKNRSALGDAIPANGELTYKTASAAYVRWLATCLERGIASDLALAQPATLFGRAVLEGAKGQPWEKLLKSAKTSPWSGLPDGVRAEITAHWVRTLVGPHGAGLAKMLPLPDGATVYDSVRKLVLFAALDDAFLVY